MYVTGAPIAKAGEEAAVPGGEKIHAAACSRVSSIASCDAMNLTGICVNQLITNLSCVNNPKARLTW